MNVINKWMNYKNIFLPLLLFIFCTDSSGYSKKRKKNEQKKVMPTANSTLQTAKNPVKMMLDHEDEEEKSTEKEKLPVVRPATATEDKDDLIEINLENTDLPNLLKWISDVFKVNFLTDDALQPTPQGGKVLAGNKLSFKTHTALTKKQVWDLFVTFLDLFGFGLVKGTIPHFYKVRQTAPTAPNSITKSSLASFINVNWKDLPNNDTTIRYVYFVQNSTLATIQGIVDAFRSTNATLKPLQDLNAFLLTDKASNIRSIMQVVEELDRLTQPEALSVLKLKNADAEDVVKLYNSLTKSEDPRGLAARILGTQKKPTSVYFPETLRLIAERRTNTLIILGDAEGIKKVEDFIINHVDTELKIPYSPLYIYDLQYTNAKDMADILSNVTKFAPSSSAAQSGGVREGDKYLQPITFKAEEQGNRLLIKAEKEDYLKVRDVIRKLDVKQPQIAIEVLIVNITASEDKELGTQIRNKDSNTVSKNLDFQYAGLNPPQVVPSSGSDPGSLMANLINLAQGQVVGTTLLTIANSSSGVWAIFRLLQTYARINIVSNPFLITTNKYAAEVAIGETRRVQTSTTSGERNVFSFGDISANLAVKITPQINSIGIINLVINIDINNFSDATDQNSANRDTRTVVTNANIGNGEVLAIGGLLQTIENETTTKVPILGDIPLIGWLFKNKSKSKVKSNLLVFISPRIIEPRLEGGMNSYSKQKACKAKDAMGEMRLPSEKRDPVHRWFFKDYPCENTEFIDDFIAKRNNEPECRIECERCPDEIDPDHVCCKETKRFITSNPSNTLPENQSALIIAQDEQEKTPPSPFTTRKKTSIQQSLTNFLPDNQKEAVA